MLWYKIKGGKAHALHRVLFGNHVEFWCGKERNFDEVTLAQYNDEQCLDCQAYIKNRSAAETKERGEARQ